jgi:hypothetical protein
MIEGTTLGDEIGRRKREATTRALTKPKVA